MQAIFRTTVAIWLMLGGVAFAQSKPVVVELFTSQGCSSCPPADRILTSLAKRDDVIALALHVDYWDYIGWKDSFADPRYTKRQKSYARAAGSRSVFTPQFVIGGNDTVVGAKAMELADQIREHARIPYPIELKAKRSGSKISVTAPPNGANQSGEMVLMLAEYSASQNVAIKRGENAGRTLTYSNVVTALDEVGRWRGKSPLSVQVDWPAGKPVVVFLQRENHGPIVAATRLP